MTQIVTNVEDAFQALVTFVKMTPEIREFLTDRARAKPHPGTFLVEPTHLCFPDQCHEKLVWFTRQELIDRISFRRFRDDGIQDSFDSYSTVPNTFSVLCLAPIPLGRKKRRKFQEKNVRYMGMGAFFAYYQDKEMCILHVDYDENKKARIGRAPTISERAENYSGGAFGSKVNERKMNADDCIAKCANPECDVSELKREYRKESMKMAKSAFPRGMCWKVPNRLMKCARCEKVLYCSRACQKKHWKVHKTSCSTNI